MAQIALTLSCLRYVPSSDNITYYVFQSSIRTCKHYDRVTITYKRTGNIIDDNDDLKVRVFILLSLFRDVSQN